MQILPCDFDNCTEMVEVEDDVDPDDDDVLILCDTDRIFMQLMMNRNNH